MNSTCDTETDSHDAVILHCFDEDCNWGCLALQALEGLSCARHQTVFTLWEHNNNYDVTYSPLKSGELNIQCTMNRTKGTLITV